MTLHPKQWVALETPATEILYGGAAGGGKSFLIREAAIKWCGDIPGLQVYLFRRQYGDLIKNHMEGPKGFRNSLAPWVSIGKAAIVNEEIRFWNGSKIFLCHCHNAKDIYNYQGAEMHVLLVDEITHFAEDMYKYLRGRVRMVGIKVPDEYRGMFPRILCGGNPGNIGHLWVKNAWISSALPAKIRLMPRTEGGMLRQYIPARLEDNPSMATDDPSYEQKLEGLGSASLVKALRWGDWNVVEGAFFDCWNEAKHVIPPFTIPDDWIRFRSGDWGFASPFSIGWWAVVQDDYALDDDGDAEKVSAADHARLRQGASVPRLHGRRLLPRGAIIRYREYYGKGAGTNVGARLDADVVARRICQLEGRENIERAVLDPSTFKHDSGPSIAERMNTVFAQRGHTQFIEADNTRVTRAGNRDRSGPMSGWDQMRARMVGRGGVPMIYCFSTCLDSIRTIPVLQHDQSKAEDLDTNMEDHAADDWRYACSSRPWLRTIEEKPTPKDGYHTPAEQAATDSFKTL